MYISGFLSIITSPIWYGVVPPSAFFTIGTILILPGGIDGTSQMFGDRESTNIARGITGFGLGAGIVCIVYGLVFVLI